MLFFRKKADPITDLWKWFVKNEQQLFDAPGGSKPFEEFLKRLKTVHESLTYACGKEGVVPRELNLSADGIKEAFDSVDAVADAAPSLPRWQLVRFRPREADYASSSIVMGGREISGQDVEFVLTSNGVQIGIDLFIRGCEADDDRAFVGIAFIHADAALGEYDMGCKVGAFRVRAWNSDFAREHRRPFSDLRDDFDEAFERLCTSM